MRPSAIVLAHGSGVDEAALVLVPLVILAVLQWLSRRRARREGNGFDGASDALARRREIDAGGPPRAGPDAPERGGTG